MQVELFQPKPFLFDLDSGRNILSQRLPTRRPTKELTGSLCLFARIGAPKDSRVGAQLVRLLVRQLSNRLGSYKAESVCLLSNQLRDLLEGLLMLVSTMHRIRYCKKGSLLMRHFQRSIAHSHSTTLHPHPEPPSQPI